MERKKVGKKRLLNFVSLWLIKNSIVYTNNAIFLETPWQYRLELAGCCNVRTWKKFGYIHLAFDNVRVPHTVCGLSMTLDLLISGFGGK